MRRLAVVAVLIAGCSGPGGDDVAAPAPAPMTGTVWRQVPALDADSAGPVQVVWDGALGRPRLVTGVFAAPGDDAEAIARAVLAHHADLFALAPDAAELAVIGIRDGQAGTYVRFEQRVGGLPVFGGGVIALVSGGAVRTINLAHRGVLAAPDVAGDLGPDAALAALRAAIGPIAGERAAPTIERGVAVAADATRLAYRITVLADGPRATWRGLVDAITGEVSDLRDLRVRATGTGRVFDPNAVDTTGDVTLVDGNDADTAALTAALFTVDLDHLDGSGVLRGSWADVRSLSTRANEPTLTFNYTRTDDRFEEVMTYFHLDRTQQHIQDLGFTGATAIIARPQVAIVNAIPDDNSFFDPGSGQIEYGHGGVDDAEDGDIVLHEYGHAIHHDVVPNWGNGDESAMGEGFGDYLGGGFSSTLAAAAGRPGMVDPACVGEWDATSYSSTNPPCLRRLDAVKHWPEAGSGEPHDDGEIWSAGLWLARTALGADLADTLVLEHHFMLSDTETFDSAAAALLATDTQMHGGANAVAVRRALYARGLLRTPQPPAAATGVSGTMAVSVDNPRVGAVYANRLDDSQTVTFPGAGAVQLHFATIDTEEDTGPSCLDGGCDNIYLSDADGDLYQILHGVEADQSSVTIPGDTVVVRLVTDRSVQKAGYHVDRIDAIGEAPVIPDAAGPDAGGPGEDGDGGGCCQGSAGGSAPLAMIVLVLILRRRHGSI